MVRSLNLRFDNSVFEDLKEAKANYEKKVNECVSWEDFAMEVMLKWRK
jgi:hypothetical protein